MKLIKDIAWNFLSIVIPAVLTFPVFAWIARLVGVEIFGIYTLSFAIVGYASIFDLGFSRALIREVAINKNDSQIVMRFVNTATALTTLLGVLACAILFVISEYLIEFINVSKVVWLDSVQGMMILSLCLPLLLVSNVWLAYFEGLEKFKELSYFKIITSTFTITLPLVVALYHASFVGLILGLLLARFLTVILTWLWIKRYIDIKFEIDRVYAKQLFGFGGWLTVSSIIGPVMVYFDRFILSSLIGAKQVAFYTVPSELVVRMVSLPSAVSRPLFPKFSSNIGDKERLFSLSVFIIGISAFAVALPIFIFAEPILVLWMGQSFVGEPKWVLRILLIGFIVNSVAQIPFSYLQAHGLSKQTAMLHAIEIIPYLLFLYIFIKSFGLIGAATAWSIRSIVDFMLLIFLVKRYQRVS